VRVGIVPRPSLLRDPSRELGAMGRNNGNAGGAVTARINRVSQLQGRFFGAAFLYSVEKVSPNRIERANDQPVMTANRLRTFQVE
jgi:hypothetical protein